MHEQQTATYQLPTSTQPGTKSDIHVLTIQSTARKVGGSPHQLSIYTRRKTNRQTDKQTDLDSPPLSHNATEADFTASGSDETHAVGLGIDGLSGQKAHLWA